MKCEETVMNLHFPQYTECTVARLVVLLLAFLFIQVSAQAQTTPTPQEQACFNAVQGKVAWDRAGSKQWQEVNVRDLCRGTRNPSETITCFQSQIQSHGEWKKAIAACNKSQPVTGAAMSAPAGQRKFPETYRPPITLGPKKDGPLLMMIDNFYVRDTTATTALVPLVALEDKNKAGKALEFIINNIPDRNLGAIPAVAHLVLTPKAVYTNGLLNLHLTTANSAIEIPQKNYVNSAKEQGWYIDRVETMISYDKNLYERRGWGLQNNNQTGQVVDMNNLTLALRLDNSNYTVGTSFGHTVAEFGYKDQSSSSEGVVGGFWTLSEQFGNLLNKDGIGQIIGLKEPPAMATSNFPLYGQFVIKSNTQNFQPPTASFDIKLKVRFKRTFLAGQAYNAAATSPITWIFFPPFYKGELYNRMGTESYETERNYKLTLDLAPLYK